MKFSRKNVLHVIQERIDGIDFILAETSVPKEPYTERRNAYSNVIHDIEEMT